jgi:glutamate-5-semialdehyde dehydrogenase
MCRAARRAGRALAVTDDSVRSTALRNAAEALRSDTDRIVAENAKDVSAGRDNGLTEALIDRLTLTPDRSGIHIRQIRIPIGVIAVIYESRPNVTADVAALCIKAGNACILKGGKEAIRSNTIIADLLQAAFIDVGVPADAMQLIRRTDRATTTELLTQEEFVDVIIPRGGPGLVRAIAEHSSIPVIKHYEGVCNTFVDASADLSSAVDIAINAKVQRPGVCNAMENLVVHRDVAESFLRAVEPELREAGVELRADERAAAILAQSTPATDADWSTEYLDLTLAVKIVDSVGEAIDFINENGTGHSDAIITADEANAERFLREVDSAVVYQNASTRFTDGFAFGFGAEVGISTNRIHARGPMGLRELTTYKYVVLGTGQVR